MYNYFLTKVTRICKGKWTVSLINCVEKNWISICKKMKLDHYFMHIQENIKSIRSETPKLLEENNRDQTCMVLVWVMIFWELIPKIDSKRKTGKQHTPN
jgi:hypothetical protein